MDETVWIEERANSDLIKAFVNSNILPAGFDALASVDGARSWLHGQGLLAGDTTLAEAERRRIVAVREALRALLLANNGTDLDQEAVTTINRELLMTPWHCRFALDAPPRFVPASLGVDGAIGRLLAAVAVLKLRGVWPRLKVCRAGACHLAYFDRTKNGSRVWCAMQTCGSREKAKAYQRRLRSRHAAAFTADAL